MPTNKPLLSLRETVKVRELDNGDLAHHFPLTPTLSQRERGLT